MYIRLPPMDLCQYQNALGEPETGPHSSRFMGFAAIDLFLTLYVSVAIAHFFDKNPFKVFGVLMIVAILLHWIFCVPTALNVMLGLA